MRHQGGQAFGLLLGVALGGRQGFEFGGQPGGGDVVFSAAAGLIAQGVEVGLGAADDGLAGIHIAQLRAAEIGAVGAAQAGEVAAGGARAGQALAQFAHKPGNALAGAGQFGQLGGVGLVGGPGITQGAHMQEQGAVERVQGLQLTQAQGLGAA